MSLAALVLLPFVGSFITFFLTTKSRTALASVAGLVSVLGAAGVLTLYPKVRAGGVLREEIPWLPSAGIDVVLRLDGFSWMFGLLITVIGALVTLYARYYMSPEDPVKRFYAAFLAFQGAMLGVVLSGNLIQLALFWELTSLASFLLIGYWHHRTDARRGARMALIVTGTGGLALLGGFILVGHMAGSFDLDQVLAAGDRIRDHSLYPIALVLILLGVFTKSAQFPFHFWLPEAMAAPTPVSSYLHSATMVKAGVFLLARLWPVLSGTDLWFWLVSSAGMATLLFGSYIAMFQYDLKRLLAYSTVSHLGLITLLFGLNSPLAAVAGVFHIMNHATFKASLFMATGIVDHETGTRDIRRLSGLRRLMPITGILALVASGAMAGVPLLNGFLSKEMFLAETVELSSNDLASIGLPLLATLASAFAVVYSLRFGVDIFLGPTSTDLPRQPKEPPRWMRIPIEVLVLVCLAVGVAPAFVIGPALAAAATPVVGGTLPEYSLAIWHGFNAPFFMSAIAITSGIAGYRILRRQQSRGFLEHPFLLSRFDGRRWFESSLVVMTRFSRWAKQLLGTKRLQPQLVLIVAVTLLVAALASGGEPLHWGERERLPVSPSFVLFWVVGMVCAISAALTAKHHRLMALCLMGGAGLVTCLTFMWFSALDLALTQLVVEIVTTMLFLLGLRWLPPRFQGVVRPLRLRDRARRGRDLVLAVLSGGGLAALSYAIMTRTPDRSISPFFLERALPEGGGTNVVNVMLVDFRAFDTMGEITVLGAVALTVFALLRRFRPAPESIEPPQQQRALPPDVVTDLVNPRIARTATDPDRGYMMIPGVIARWLLPVAFVIAFHLLLRGHNEPGGGFVGGLIVAVAYLMLYLVGGTYWVESHVNIRPHRWISFGLIIAALTGLGAVAFGFPFLTTHSPHVTLPIIGEVHLPSAAIFDVGVFSVVVGAVLLILTALAHQSIRAHRQAAVHGSVPAKKAGED